MSGLTLSRWAQLSTHLTVKRVTVGGATILGTGYVFLYPKKRKLFQSTIGSYIRFARSLKIGLTISLDYWICPLLGYSENEIHKSAADLIVKGCLQNGGLYVKIGQGLSAVNHILPKQYIDVLSVLQDKCLIRGKSELEEIFLEDFGKKPEEVLKKIDPVPVAAGSLAQVFKGETKEGDSIAVKVQYIDLQDRFLSDMKTLKFLLWIISIMHPKFNLHWVLDELSDTLEQELNFRTEGKNGERCFRELKKYHYVYVPKIYWDLTTERILTTEWIDGIKVSDTEKLKEQGLDIADVDKKLITLMAEQIFHTGFVHADPHPGNVLVRKGKDNKAEIVLLDHGLYEYLYEKTRVSLCNFWESMVLKDSNGLKTYAEDLNVKDHILLTEILTQSPYSLQLFSAGDKGKLTSEEYMIKQAQERFDRITAALRSMPKNMLLVIRNLNIIRAITREHGDVVDRYKIMGRIAVRGKYTASNWSFSKNIVGLCSRVKFEFRLWLYSLTQWIMEKYVQFAYEKIAVGITQAQKEYSVYFS